MYLDVSFDQLYDTVKNISFIASCILQKLFVMNNLVEFVEKYATL